MFEKLLKLYVMAMAGDVRSPMPHLFGPPGCGKSTVVEQLADHLGVNLHIINVSRLSPLEIEGVQMPVDMETNPRLHMLTATFWTQLKEGDILMLEELLRGFPEVYNGLLDIFTSRRVGGFIIPKVFILGASNSTVAYDKALEDRLLHLPVPDVRTNKTEAKRLGEILVAALGLMPEMVESYEMQSLIKDEVAPMYEILDQIKGKGSANAASIKGHSIRNLIGQAQLREVKSTPLKELLDMNNARAVQKGQEQHMFLLNGKGVTPKDIQRMKDLSTHPKMSELQQRNLRLNLQLVELEEVRHQQKMEILDDDDDGLDDLFQ